MCPSHVAYRQRVHLIDWFSLLYRWVLNRIRDIWCEIWSRITQWMNKRGAADRQRLVIVRFFYCSIVRWFFIYLWVAVAIDRGHAWPFSSSVIVTTHRQHLQMQSHKQIQIIQKDSDEYEFYLLCGQFGAKSVSSLAFGHWVFFVVFSTLFSSQHKVISFFRSAAFYSCSQIQTVDQDSAQNPLY